MVTKAPGDTVNIFCTITNIGKEDLTVDINWGIDVTGISSDSMVSLPIESSYDFSKSFVLPTAWPLGIYDVWVSVNDAITGEYYGDRTTPGELIVS